jgi:hypothetical protein
LFSIKSNGISLREISWKGKTYLIPVIITIILRRIKVDLLSLLEYPNQFLKKSLNESIKIKSAVRLNAI